MLPKQTILAQAVALLVIATGTSAQSIPGAVLAKREPHHHPVYEDSTLRVLRVRVPAHDTTLLHEHGPDYFWIALGASTVVNAKLGAPDATITSRDLSVHYTPGKFAHVARNPGTQPFDNITVELLEPQTDIRNLCEAALADKALDCAPVPAKGSFTGATEHPAFATARLRVGLLTLAPGGTLRSASGGRGAWIIALDSADAGRRLVAEGAAWVGGTLRAPSKGPWSVTNRGPSPIRVIGVARP
jgi:hypothetical protein